MNIYYISFFISGFATTILFMSSFTLRKVSVIDSVLTLVLRENSNIFLYIRDFKRFKIQFRYPIC